MLKHLLWASCPADSPGYAAPLRCPVCTMPADSHSWTQKPFHVQAPEEQQPAFMPTWQCQPTAEACGSCNHQQQCSPSHQQQQQQCPAPSWACCGSSLRSSRQLGSRPKPGCPVQDETDRAEGPLQGTGAAGHGQQSRAGATHLGRTAAATAGGWTLPTSASSSSFSRSSRGC